MKQAVSAMTIALTAAFTQTADTESLLESYVVSPNCVSQVLTDLSRVEGGMWRGRSDGTGQYTIYTPSTASSTEEAYAGFLQQLLILRPTEKLKV